jgi:pantetheine-phosphate adenylyltransferase
MSAEVIESRRPLNIAVYPGTFDPITHGHSDLVRRAAKMFDKVILAIAHNPKKSPLLSLDERIALAKEVLDDIPNVSVEGFQCLLVDFVNDKNANIILRGLRSVTDFEFEFQLADMNRKLAPQVETLFLSPDNEFSYISSTLIREISSLGGDVTPFVHPAVNNVLKQRFAR